MRFPLKQEKTTFIKEAFEKMQTKEELLALLNTVADLQENWYLPGPKVLVEVSLAELLQKTDKSENGPLAIKEKPLITPKQLNFFSTSFGDKGKKRNRYTQFYIRKKSGQMREIKAPLPKLKEIQRAINTILGTVYQVQEPAYGFVPGKSIVDNAMVHAGAPFILNIDIKDFFPSIYFKRIKLMLEKPPFNLKEQREPLAFLIANLCTENGVLPQGASTSPLFTNIICQRLDKKLQQLALQFHATYSRYADDITFSSQEYIFTKRFMLRLEKILKDDRFEINPEKTRIQGKAFRQEVTGLTVNEKVNVSKQFYRSYRTLVHLYKTKGAQIAFEYHKGRMSPGTALVKLKKEMKSLDTYMQNVIWGKYYFLIMVTMDRKLDPPFIKETNDIKLGKSLDTLEQPIPLSVGKIEAQPVDMYPINYIVDGEMLTVLAESPQSPYGSEKALKSADLIERILAAWEKESEDGGFRNAMELVKQQSNEK